MMTELSGQPYAGTLRRWGMERLRRVKSDLKPRFVTPSIGLTPSLGIEFGDGTWMAASSAWVSMKVWWAGRLEIVSDDNDIINLRSVFWAATPR
jgi:hypothetical protein